MRVSRSVICREHNRSHEEERREGWCGGGGLRRERGRTLSSAIKEVRAVLDVLERARVVRNLVVRVRRGGVADEDARDVVWELLGDLGVGGEER